MTCFHTEGMGHDCRYVDARNRLLADAESITYAAMGREPVDDEGRRAWRRKFGPAFLRTMQALWTGRKTAKARVSA